MAFASISTQWRACSLLSGRVHYLGLDYTAARAGLEMAGLVVTPQQWEGVQIMEAEAAALLNGAGR